MAVNNKFELYKVRREIRRNGTELKFFREDKNEFGEPTGEPKEVASIKGFYYEHSPHILDAYIIMLGADAATTRTKKTPVLLCPWEDIFEQVERPEPQPDSELSAEEPVEEPKKCKFQIGDYVMINGHESHVTGIYNVMEWNLICHISFEEVDYGSQSVLPGGQKSDKSSAQEDGCQQSNGDG